jgi:hypothetical protein
MASGENPKTICKSAISFKDSSRCNFTAKIGSEYCGLHLYRNYVPIEIDTNTTLSMTLATESEHFYKVVLRPDSPKEEDPEEKIKPKKSRVERNRNRRSNRPERDSSSKTVFEENKISNVQSTLDKIQDIINMKYLILSNDEELLALLKEYVGPIYDDVTLSTNETDPLTFDPIWEIDDNGSKIPCIPNWQLFSYECLNHKVLKCVTIDTLYDVFFLHKSNSSDLGIFMSPNDETRALNLIEWYDYMLNFFSTRDAEISPELALHNRLVALFAKFKDNTTCFEESWLENITSVSNLKTVITNTHDILRQNYNLITESPEGAKLFNTKFSLSSTILDYKTYIVDEWEKMVKLASVDNQYPRWIIALGLSRVVPEILVKYPNIKYML